MTNEPWQQGSGDGLCGLYAAANFLRDKKPLKRANNHKEVLFNPFEQCERHGWLSAKTLRDGFDETQLAKVLNGIFSRHGMSFRAEEMQLYHRNQRGRQPFYYVKALVEEGGAAIVDWENRKHWILVKAVVRRSIEIWDSDHARNPVRLLSSTRIASMKRPNGVVILKDHKVS